MANRGKISTNRQTNESQYDDDNCSVICYKHPDNRHVGVIRIRQPSICSACNLLSGTLSSYYKHIVDHNHRENVKKLCDKNRFVPSIYDQAIHLAFQNNFQYQSEKFHFLYKHINDEILENGKMIRKQRNFQITLVFQDKTYSKIGVANAYIREQLLKEMVADRAVDIAALPMEIYYTKKKNTFEDTEMNITIKDQSHVMIKEQQQESFKNGQLSSAENSRMTNINDHKEQPSIADNIVCKSVLNNLVRDVYTKSEEFKRERMFLNHLARRNFKRRRTFYCDLCDMLLTCKNTCSLHLNSSEHLEKTSQYETICLPWRRAMQKSIVTGKSLRATMDLDTYDNYISTMALYLAPDSLSNRGRFCCAYCEVILTHQWLLEKHLHSVEHKSKQTSADHRELVIRFTNSINFSAVFKFNGISQLSEVPDDIKTRYRWQVITHAQLDDDTKSFIQGYPFDALEGVTRLRSSKAAQKQKLAEKRSHVHFSKKDKKHSRNQVPNRVTTGKRSASPTIPPSKRFREDLNTKYPDTNQQPNFQSQSVASDNNGHHDNRSSYPKLGDYNYNQNQQASINDKRQSNFSHPRTQTRTDHYSKPNQSHQQSNTGPINNLPYPQQQWNSTQQSTLMPLMSIVHSQDQYIFGAFANNHNSNNSNIYSPSVNHRSTSMYMPYANTLNPVVPQVHTFEGVGNPSSTYNSFNSHLHPQESHYGNYGYQNQMKQNSSRGSFRDDITNSFQSNKQPAASFYYNSWSNNNNNNNNYTNFSNRGRGTSQNTGYSNRRVNYR